MANSTLTEKLREQLAGRQWPSAIDSLQSLGPGPAADLMLALPYEQQRALFSQLPYDLAARLIAHFPYYHAYVLLHARPLRELQAIVNAMNSGDRDRFLDELPEEAWQFLMNELSVPVPAEPVEAEPFGASRAAGCSRRTPSGAAARGHH